jgi:hypothetical protein
LVVVDVRWFVVWYDARDTYLSYQFVVVQTFVALRSSFVFASPIHLHSHIAPQASSLITDASLDHSIVS